MSATDEQGGQDGQRYPNLLRELAAAVGEGGDAVPAVDGAAGEFLFDDGLYARLRPVEEEILAEVYLLDLSLISGPARALLFHAIGQCNAVGAAGRPFVVGVDERDYALLYRRLPLAGLTAEGLLSELAYLVDQGRAVRALLNQLAFGTLPAPAAASPAGDRA